MFDMDGVIISSEISKFKYLKEIMYKRYSVRVKEESFKHCLGKTAKDFLGMLDIDDVISTKVLFDFKTEYLANITNYAQPIGPAVEFIKRHGKNIDIVIVSGGYQEVNEKIIFDFGLSEFIKGIFSRESVKKSKPHPDIYLNAVKQTGFLIDECAAIEDSVVGIMAANVAGIDSFAYVNDYDTEKNFSSVEVVNYLKTIEDYEKSLLISLGSN